MILKTNNLNGKNFYFRSLKNEEHYVVKLLKLTSVDLVQAYYPSLWTSYVNTPDDSLVDTIKEFLNGYDENEEYKQFIQSGTSSSSSVRSRFDYWRNIIKEL